MQSQRDAVKGSHKCKSGWVVVVMTRRRFLGHPSYPAFPSFMRAAPPQAETGRDRLNH